MGVLVLQLTVTVISQTYDSYFFMKSIILGMHYSGDIAYAFTHIPLMFLSTEILFKQRVRDITMRLLYIKFTFQTKDNLQGCLGLCN